MNNKFDKVMEYQERCKGCGVCAAACPTESIDIHLNNHGEYQPDVNIDSCTNCGRCRAVCPMDTNITGPVELFGAYSRFYVAHATDNVSRRSSSSGGVVTQIFQHLLSSGAVDKTICAGFKDGVRPFFGAYVCESAEDVFRARGSKYYLIEFSKILKIVKKSEETYAMVCLPCVATAIKRLKTIDKRFERIKHVISLTCGHNKTAHYTDFLLGHFNLSAPYKQISFREKGDFPFSNFALKVVDGAGRQHIENFSHGIIKQLWTGFFFAQKACLGCRDLFGIDADVSCMDAWLRPYSNSHSGYSFVMCGNGSKSLLEQNPAITYEAIDRQAIIDSQKAMVERKSSGFIPEEYLENMNFSDNCIGVGGYEALKMRLSQQEDRWKQLYRSVIKDSIYKLKSRFSPRTDNENLITM